MRKLLAIFLTISLSWITTGYACRLDDRLAVRAVCCCKGKTMAEPRRDSGKAMTGFAAKQPCCDTTISASVDQQNPGAVSASVIPDLPATAGVPSLDWTVLAPRVRFIPGPPPARGPPGTGSRTYLATARLRI